MGSAYVPDLYIYYVSLLKLISGENFIIHNKSTIVTVFVMFGAYTKIWWIC